MLKFFGIGTGDAGIEADRIAHAQEDSDTPEGLRADAVVGAHVRAGRSLVRSGIPINFNAALGPGLRRDLPFALVEMERRIQFSLAAQQLLEPRLVLERSAGY